MVERTGTGGPGACGHSRQDPGALGRHRHTQRLRLYDHTMVAYGVFQGIELDLTQGRPLSEPSFIAWTRRPTARSPS